MSIKNLIMGLSITVVATAGFIGGSVNTSTPGWVTVTLQQAEASPYRRSVRRTARRTSRRTAHRHSYGGGGVAVGAAVITAVAVGTMVATLPPACNTVNVGGVIYRNCSGTYYVPSGSQWVVVNAP